MKIPYALCKHIIQLWGNSVLEKEKDLVIESSYFCVD